MKQLLRIAAVLSFLFPFVSGVGLVLLGLVSARTTEDAFIPIAIGCFLVGNAIFVGGILLVAAERLDRKDGSR